MLKIEKEKNVVPMLHNWVDNIFGRDDDFMFRNFGFFNKTTPAVNIFETPEAFYLEVAVPGLKRSDFMVAIDNGVLEIKTELEMPKEEKEKVWTRKEFDFFNFKRTFLLPENINKEVIKAKYINGLLKLMLPKLEVKMEKLKEIPIES